MQVIFKTRLPFWPGHKFSFREEDCFWKHKKTSNFVTFFPLKKFRQKTKVLFSRNINNETLNQKRANFLLTQTHQKFFFTRKGNLKPNIFFHSLLRGKGRKYYSVNKHQTNGSEFFVNWIDIDTILNIICPHLQLNFKPNSVNGHLSIAFKCQVLFRGPILFLMINVDGIKWLPKQQPHFWVWKVVVVQKFECIFVM